MAILFSVVTMKSGEAKSEFLVGGIPRIKNDLKGWVAYEKFMDELSGKQEITVTVEPYLYGDGVIETATVEEVAYMKIRMEKCADFIEMRCLSQGLIRFTLLYKNGKCVNSKEHPKLIGSSNVRNKTLSSVREVAEFIIKDGQYGDVTVKYIDGAPLLKTDGIYVTGIMDFAYATKLLKILIPMLKKVERGEEVK